jgi:hypothetical protein
MFAVASRLQTHPNRPGFVVVPHPRKDLATGLVTVIREQAGLQEAGMRYPITIEPGTDTTAFCVTVVDAALLHDTTERVNITLPRRMLTCLGALARAAGESRSGYIAHLTLEETRHVA